MRNAAAVMAELMNKENTDIPSAREVAVDHFVKMKMKHRTTVTLNEGTFQKE